MPVPDGDIRLCEEFLQRLKESLKAEEDKTQSLREVIEAFRPIPASRKPVYPNDG